jgi:hypothetical protein
MKLECVGTLEDETCFAFTCRLGLHFEVRLSGEFVAKFSLKRVLCVLLFFHCLRQLSTCEFFLP